VIGELVESGLYRLFRFNPCVAMNELRMRMRGVRPFLVLCVYSSLAAAAVLIALAAMSFEGRFVLRPGGSDVGRGAFTALIHTQLTLMLLILPAYGAGAITMEREKRTLDMLRVALLTPGDIISGKLVSVLAFGLVLLLAPLPVAAWCLLLGGISPGEIFLSYSYLLAVVVFASSLGVWFSAILRRSLSAVVATYGSLIALGVASTVIPAVFETLASQTGRRPTFGADFGAVLWLLVALGAAYLVFLAARWLMARILRRRRFLAVAVSVLASVGTLWCLLFSSSPLNLLPALPGVPVMWLMVLNPYVSLEAALEPDLAATIASGGARLSTPTQVWVWAAATATLVGLSVLLWTFSIRLFRART